MVDRFDIVSSRDGKKTENTWLIMRIDLETQQTLPHLFLRPLGHTPDAYNKFFDAFHHLQPVNAMMLGGHTPEFHGRYEIYTMASRALEIEEYFTAEVTQIIGACFWPHAIELLDNKLYIYTTNPTLTDSLLNTALESGLWLARILDKQQD